MNGKIRIQLGEVQKTLLIHVTIVNIGAGLDTGFQRIDNGKITWYDLDLDDSMALRRQLIPESERNNYIAKSFFDRSWFKDIKVRGSKTIFIAGGVLVYLKEDEVKAMILDLVREFPGSEMIFEIYSKLLFWIRRRAVAKRKGTTDLLAPFQWAANSGKGISRWSDRIKVIDEFPFYSRVDFPEDLDEKTLSQFKTINFLRMMKMVQLRLGP